MHVKPHRKSRAMLLGVVSIPFASALLCAVPEAAWSTPAWFDTYPTPPALYRDHAAVTADVRRGRALAFGGTLTRPEQGGAGDQSDSDSTYSFGFEDVARMRALPVAGARPSARGYAALAYDSLADRAWLFGGRSQRLVSPELQLYHPVPLADLWSLDASADVAAWQSVTPQGPGPSRRFGHSMVADRVHRRLIVYGGRDSLGTCFGDVWQLDLTSAPPRWSVLDPGGTAPTPRWRHVAEFDPVTQRMFVHGGSSATDTLRSTWVLDFSGTPRWDSVTVAPGPGTITALAWDSRRSRLLGYTPASARVSVLDSTAGTPAWTTVPVWPGPFSQPPSVDGEVRGAYDARHDQFLLPYAHCIGRGSIPSISVPWSLALDVTAAPAAPARLSPQRLSHDAWRGQLRVRWSLPSSGGLLYALPSLEAEVNPDSWDPWFLPVGSPAAWYPDSAIAHWRYPEQPQRWIRWQVVWYDPIESHVVRSWYGLTPPAPIAMACTVDSAEVGGGGMRLQWTLANDSLSWLAEPHVWRRTVTTVTTTTDLGVAWPDSSRRIRLIDPGIVSGTTCTYWIAWRTHVGTRTIGTVTRTVGPYRVERLQPGLGTYVRWTAPGTAPFTATAYRRTSEADAWVEFGTLDADLHRDLVVRERGLPLDSHVEYLLGWLDSGVEAYSSAEAFDVPPFSAAVETLLVGTRRTRIVWSVWPCDSSLAMTTHHSIDGVVDEALADAGVPLVPRADSLTGSAGEIEQLWVSAHQGATDFPSAMTSFVRPRPPRLASLAIGSGGVRLGWTASAAADAYEVWRAADAGPLARVASPAASGDTVAYAEAIPSGTDSLRFQLRWHEWDGLWRATVDTTVVITIPSPPLTMARFELATPQPSNGTPYFRYALPDARAASVVFLDLGGRELWRTTLTGTGTLGAPASLRSGVYWVRFTHATRTLTRRVVVLR